MTVLTKINIVTFTANTTHIIPTFTNLPVTVNTLHISDAPKLHRDKQLEKFSEETYVATISLIKT